MKRYNQGFGTIEAVIIVGMVVVLGFVGWRVWSQKQDAKPDTNSASQTTDSGQTTEQTDLPESSLYDNPALFKDEVTAVSNFYDCFFKVHEFKPGTPPTCDYDSKTYTRPAEFTNQNVRNLDKMPASTRQAVLDVAKKNFDLCKDKPSETSITTVYNAIEGYVYFGSGCDSGYRAFLVLHNGNWLEASRSQGGLSCEAVDAYNIPKTLHNYTTCYTSDNKSRTL